MATEVERPRDRMLEAVVKLMHLTQKGKLKWRAGKPDDSMKLEGGDRIDSVYVAEYNGRILQIYRRNWVDLAEARGILGAFRMATGQRRGALGTLEEYSREQTVLRLATPEGGFWTFPHNNALRDLMTAVSFQVTDAKDFLDEILSES